VDQIYDTLAAVNRYPNPTQQRTNGNCSKRRKGTKIKRSKTGERIFHPLLSRINSKKSKATRGKEGGRTGQWQGKGRERGEGGPKKALFFFLSNFIPRSLSSSTRPRISWKGEQEEEEMGRDERFPLWEATLGAGVAAAFAAGLVGVYLSMPDSDYSFLKLPRNLQELQILT
jgi:hypothetical protein